MLAARLLLVTIVFVILEFRGLRATMNETTDQLVRWSAILATCGAALLLCVDATTIVRWGRTSDGFVIGTKVDMPIGTIASAGTVILFARSSCAACQSSKSILKHVVELVHEQPGVRVVMCAVTGVNDDERAYAEDIGLRRTEVIACPVQQLRLQVVPTLLVLDRSGSIRFVQSGTRFGRSAMERLYAALRLPSIAHDVLGYPGAFGTASRSSEKRRGHSSFRLVGAYERNPGESARVTRSPSATPRAGDSL